MFRLFPIVGLNNTAHDDALRHGDKYKKLYVRDAVNIDISETGSLSLRKSGRLVTDKSYRNIWQSSLHGDVFGVLDHQLMKINTSTWEGELLAYVGERHVSYEVVNNLVYINSGIGILIYNGELIAPLNIDTPPPPLLLVEGGGNLLGMSSYNVAVTWLRSGKESGLSSPDMVVVEQHDSLIKVVLPRCWDNTIDQVRVYVSDSNGSELQLFGDYPISTTEIEIHDVGQLGMAAKHTALSPMPHGKDMKYWQGRLITYDKNIISFSEPLAYHLHDTRFGFVLMPQLITFIQPVDGGIWVGQVTHVVFLSGSRPENMAFQEKSAHAPIPNSVITLPADEVGELAQGGMTTALWLSSNGYVLGTSSGQIVELHAGVISQLTAKSAKSVSLGRRLITIVN